MAIATRRSSSLVSRQATRVAATGGYPDSFLIDYLPAIYQQDPFMRRFLLIFESVLGPLEQVVDSLALYTEPEMAPAEFLPWLAHWVAVTLDSSWPVDAQRALISNAVEIYRWRGTKRGLKLHIASYTGLEPLIQEFFDGFVIGSESGLGWTTQMVSAARNAALFSVTVAVPNPERIDPEVIRAIIDQDKPAHATYRLHIVRSETAPNRLSRFGAHANGRGRGHELTDTRGVQAHES